MRTIWRGTSINFITFVIISSVLITTRKRDCYTHRFPFEIAERETILIQVNDFLFSKWHGLPSSYTNTKNYRVLCYD